MSPELPDRIITRGFSRAFEQMCNFIAVARTGQPEETIKGLVTLCFVLVPDEYFDSADSIRTAIETLFGVAIPSKNIQPALDKLETQGVITKPTGRNYVLCADVQQSLQDSIQEVRALEEQVKTSWYKTLEVSHPKLPKDAAWKALQAYLSRTFRRHGIQAAALLDPSIDIPSEYEVSLSAILKDSVEGTVATENRDEAHIAISSFLRDIGKDPQCRKYIIQLADGAFNFYTLEASPEVADQMRKRLSRLVLFLDTNFLFGILDLHYNPQVDVSRDLLRAIEECKLPFDLRYHEATAREMLNTVSTYGSILRSRAWTRALSRAAAASQNLPGIEQKFHERNAAGAIDVDEFLRPYEHLDVLLSQYHIDIYRVSAERLQERTDLFVEYKAFLERNGRGDKRYSIIMHDATVLDMTRQLRTQAKSSLEAGALLISCDYYLYRFDWETARRDGHRACVLIPNIFWQILRPFIPSDHDFEKAFAETFALPEFRALGSGGSDACSKMLQILAAYKDVPEETAFKMLSNDLLLDRLKVTADETLFKECVDSALVEMNKNLLEEKAALAQRLQEEEQSRAQLAKRHEDLRNMEEDERRRLSKSLEEAQSQVAAAKDTIAEKQRIAQEENERANQAELASKQATAEASRKDKHLFAVSLVAGVAVGALIVLAFELCVHLIPWVWMRDHPNTLPLQIGVSAVLFLGCSSAFVSKWRKWCLVMVLLPLGLVILKLLGGKIPPASP